MHSYRTVEIFLRAYMGPWYLIRMLYPKLKISEADKRHSHIIIFTNTHIKKLDFKVKGLTPTIDRIYYMDDGINAAILLVIKLDKLFTKSSSNITVNLVYLGNAPLSKDKESLKWYFTPIINLACHKRFEGISGKYFKVCDEFDPKSYRSSTKLLGIFSQKAYTEGKADTLYASTCRFLDADQQLPPIN